MNKRQEGEPFARITSIEAQEIIEQEPSTVQVIDVRNPNEYESGHVANSINIPVNDVLTRFSELPTEKRLLFICQMGARSGLACEMVAAMGVEPDLIFNIEDGTPTWIQNNLPTNHGSTP
jgi:rhodanese-related sulfurtransferase